MNGLELKHVPDSKYQVGDIVILKQQEGFYLVSRIHVRYKTISYECVPLCHKGWIQMLDATDIDHSIDSVRNRIVDNIMKKSTIVYRKSS